MKSLALSSVVIAAVLSACSDTSGPAPPRVPGNLTASQLSFTTIRLSWSTSGPPGTYYLLQRATAGAFTQVGPLIGRAFVVDSGVTPGVAYRYRVAAVTLQDTSAFSATTTFSTAVVCPAPASAHSVLVDASHDGGAWWYPQVAPFDPAEPHQGKPLADTLRAKGYVVDEVSRGDTIDRHRLFASAVVIRAAKFGSYEESELFAYDDFVACPRTLLLLGEFHWPGERDELADRLGIPLDTAFTGTITQFAPHAITSSVGDLPFIAGSVIRGPVSDSVHVLGWLATGEAVMGVLEGRPARVFFIGDTNGLELVPQPLVNNLISWGF